MLPAPCSGQRRYPLPRRRESSRPPTRWRKLTVRSAVVAESVLSGRSEGSRSESVRIPPTSWLNRVSRSRGEVRLVDTRLPPPAPGAVGVRPTLGLGRGCQEESVGDGRRQKGVTSTTTAPEERE